MAQRMGVSSAFLSNIENGKKRVPDSFVDKLAESFPEVRVQYDRFVGLANKARNEVVLSLQDSSSDDANLATALARKFSGLTEEQKKNLWAILDNNK
jgi:transcriptional regulator with XRE-family HTH domain